MVVQCQCVQSHEGQLSVLFGGIEYHGGNVDARFLLTFSLEVYEMDPRYPHNKMQDIVLNSKYACCFCRRSEMKTATYILSFSSILIYYLI